MVEKDKKIVKKKNFQKSKKIKKWLTMSLLLTKGMIQL